MKVGDLMTESEYKIINVDSSNVDEYDLLCVKSKKSSEGYQNKLKWFKERVKEGMKFKLLLVLEGTRGFRSRGMIEYIPGEYTWRGVDAIGYMVIHCIWVVGKNKKKGYGSKLLEECYKDSKGMNGVVVVTSKKGHWLPNPKLFIKHDFKKIETIQERFDLFVKRFNENAPLPKFYPINSEKGRDYGPGLTIFKTDQCPYTPGAVSAAIAFAKKHNIQHKVISITSKEEAQRNGFHPYGTYCVLFNGGYLSYCFQNEKGFLKLLNEKGIKFE